MDKSDPGNWTGGAPGKGVLKGSKYGVSAKSHPELDIANLSLDDCKRIAKAEYWDKYYCDQLPPALAFHVFDTAYHGGSPIRWLQEAVGATPDGIAGSKTIAAVRAANPAAVVMAFNRKRLTYLMGLKNWPQNAKGWTARIVRNMEVF